MRQWTQQTLLHVMACRLCDAKPLPRPMLTYCQLDPWEPTSVKFESKYEAFIHQNSFENVLCEMVAILSRESLVELKRIPWDRLLEWRLGPFGNKDQPVLRQANACIVLITVMSQWTRWRLKSQASRLFSQPFIQPQIKENIKAPRHWPLCGEFTGRRWIPRTIGQ